MQNMDCKSPKIKFFCIALFLLFFKNIAAQECVIEQWPVKPLYFTQSGLINEKYESMKTSDTSSWQMMFINFLNFSNRKECYYLAVDTNKRIIFSVISEDSVLFSGCINTPERYNIKKLMEGNKINGFYKSECSSTVSSHKKQVLVICNNSANNWAEYISMDGFLKKTLNENNAYVYFKNVYLLIEAVFKDFGFNIDPK